MDISDFEGATHIHDMNLPLPDDLRGRFSVVHDSGTLEHVFHFVQAMKNCMEMVAVGGHFSQVSNANNYMGHGFWQISPELIYRVFSPANGFQVETVLLHEVVPGGRWYVASDPEKFHGRVQLCNSRPTYILTLARKVAQVEIFATVPQESDYASAWKSSESWRPPSRPSYSGLRKRIPRPVKRFLKDALVYRKMGFRQRCFRRIDEDALLRGKLFMILPSRLPVDRARGSGSGGLARDFRFAVRVADLFGVIDQHVDSVKLLVGDLEGLTIDRPELFDQLVDAPLGLVPGHHEEIIATGLDLESQVEQVALDFHLVFRTDRKCPTNHLDRRRLIRGIHRSILLEPQDPGFFSSHRLPEHEA